MSRFAFVTFRFFHSKPCVGAILVLHGVRRLQNRQAPAYSAGSGQSSAETPVRPPPPKHPPAHVAALSRYRRWIFLPHCCAEDGTHDRDRFPSVAGVEDFF